MVQVIINLAQTLRLRTVAEGVEDQATATILHELGADLLQGYYFAHPCPADAFSALPLFSRPEEISLR
jgi:EAL domain-containing protein (putative c-di-GMP-specific phosphodiesterase class I)